MYNEFQKRRFLKYCENNIYNKSTVNLVEKIFISTEMSEIQFDKDVAEFSQVEVMDLLKNLNSKSRIRLKNTCVFLSKYFDWCYRIEKLINSIADPFDNRSIDPIIDTIIPKEELNNKFFTKVEFLEMIKNVLDISNQFIAYAFYSGLTVEELMHLKITDLDFNHNKLRLISGREISVDAMFKHLMTETNDQTQYFEDGIPKESRTKAYDYALSGYVIRTCKKLVIETVGEKYIYYRLKVIKEQMNNEFISISTIYKNGLINYIKEQFAKKKIDLKTAILKQETGRIYTYDKETQQYIDEFGSKITVRFLRMEIKDYLDLL